MLSKLSMAVVIQSSPQRTKSTLASYIDHIAAMTYTKAHQTQHATSTQPPMQAIQGIIIDGQSKIKIPCHSGLVVIFWSYFKRCTLQTKLSIGLLALQYRQQNGCMQMVSPSSLVQLVIQCILDCTFGDYNVSLFFSFQGLSLEEMAKMLSYNLSETIHNKQLQQCGNRGNNLFATTCNNKIQAVTQMTSLDHNLREIYLGLVHQGKN